MGAGHCSACGEGKRLVEHSKLLKEHNDDKAGAHINCYKTQPDQSVTQCPKVLGHKGTIALTTEPLVVPTCSEEGTKVHYKDALHVVQELHHVVWNW